MSDFTREVALRLNEVYSSVQGEGPNVGRPTIFVRFSGCNLRCPKWPCDTEHAINPEKYRQTWEWLEASEVIKRIRNHPHFDNVSNICITGGEPFLQSAVPLEQVFRALTTKGKHIDVFTNGTVEFPTWAKMADTVTKIVDIKLPGSGEDPYAFPGFNNNLLDWDYNSYAKFTIANKDDFNAACKIWDEHLRFASYSRQAYIAPVWGCVEPRDAVDWIMSQRRPFSLNLQMHKYIWPPDTRGV